MTPVVLSAFITQNSYPAAGTGGVTVHVAVHMKYPFGAVKTLPVLEPVASGAVATGAQVEPRVQVVPFTVVDAFASAALGTAS
jgi:hypothetical protein